nr:MAG TPA: terminase small subunit [Caudoviricetes sp.]
MAKGRKKISDELKSLRGTDQPCRMDGNLTPTTSAVVSIPRSGLKGTAKKVFEVVATELIHNRLLDMVGVDLLVAYAREMGLYHDMMRDAEKEGYTIVVETKFGTTTLVNPKRKIAESALMNAKALSAEFGLTPASRSRVAALLSDEEPKDDFAEFEEVK